MNEFMQELLQVLVLGFGDQMGTHTVGGRDYYEMSRICLMLGLVAPGAALDRNKKQWPELRIDGSDLYIHQADIYLSDVGTLKLITGCGTPAAVGLKKSICARLVQYWTNEINPEG